MPVAPLACDSDESDAGNPIEDIECQYAPSACDSDESDDYNPIEDIESDAGDDYNPIEDIISNTLPGDLVDELDKFMYMAMKSLEDANRDELAEAVRCERERSDHLVAEAVRCERERSNHLVAEAVRCERERFDHLVAEAVRESEHLRWSCKDCGGIDYQKFVGDH